MLRALPRAPVPVIVVILSFLCPIELSLYVAGLRLPPHRVALLLLLPLAAWRLMTARDIHIRAFDLLFFAFGVLTIVVFTYHGDGHDGLVYGGSLALEYIGAYIVSRAYVRDLESFVATLRVLFAAIVIAAAIALPETLFGQIFVHDFLANVTGYVHPTGVETRAGFTRAFATFDHPIHYGTFCAAMLAMFCYAERSNMGARTRTMFLFLATFLGLSSAPLLCLGLQCAMIVWEITTRKLPARTSLTLAVLAGLYIGATLFSNRSPIAFVATGLTFDSWTGFYRLQIWEHAWDNILDHPWAGIGLADWKRPSWMVSSTVDAFWLVVTMRQGVPSFLVLALAIALLGRAAVKRMRRHPDLRLQSLMMGWMMSLVSFCLIGATVHYWGVLNSYLFFFLGLGGALADPRRAPALAFAASGRKPSAAKMSTAQLTLPSTQGAFVHPGMPYGRLSQARR